MIARMKKLTLACIKSDADKLCRELLWLESVEVRNAISDELPQEIQISDNSKDLYAIEQSAVGCASAIDILSPYGSGKKKKRLIPKCFTRKEFEELESKRKDAEIHSAQAAELWKEISVLKGKINKAENDIASLVPFEKYGEELSFEGTRSVAVVKGTFPKLTKTDAVRAAMDESGFDYELEELGQFGDYIYVFAIFHRDDGDEVLKKLNSEGFSRVILTGFKDNAESETAKLRQAVKGYEAQIEETKDKLRMLAENLEEIREVYDYENSLLETERIKQYLLTTESSCILTGWVPEENTDELIKKLDELECAYKLDEPREEDVVPVKLNNNKFASPFESVLALYSYPDYRGIDPTFIMSIFYFIIFGLVMQDVIYGLILLIGCKVMIKLLRSKPGSGMHKMLSMFSICGISTIFFGLMFGGYMGDLPSAIATNMFGVKNFPELAIALNPVTNPMPYLVISMVMGVLHLVAGMLMNAYMLIKRGKALDALFDVGMWLVLFGGIGLLLVIPDVGMWVALAGVAGLILTQGRAEKNPIMKLLKGIMSLYDIINYISDLLSYSRIMALGLSGAIIGQVVNIIGTLGGASVIGFIVLILALALGHTLNLALSVLGAFVHTARLQYIEFLGKFFEDGGEEFKPVKIKTKYTDIAKEAK